jgi:hypothetical protein
MAFLGSVARRFNLNVFPLTPALSLGEREKVIQRWTNRTRSQAVRLCAVLPLPLGEGRGEGKAV